MFIFVHHMSLAMWYIQRLLFKHNSTYANAVLPHAFYKETLVLYVDRIKNFNIF